MLLSLVKRKKYVPVVRLLFIRVVPFRIWVCSSFPKTSHISMVKRSWAAIVNNPFEGLGYTGIFAKEEGWVPKLVFTPISYITSLSSKPCPSSKRKSLHTTCKFPLGSKRAVGGSNPGFSSFITSGLPKPVVGLYSKKELVYARKSV